MLCCHVLRRATILGVGRALVVQICLLLPLVKKIPCKGCFSMAIRRSASFQGFLCKTTRRRWFVSDTKGSRGFPSVPSKTGFRAVVWSPVVWRFDSGWCSNQGLLTRTTHPGQPMGKVRSLPSAHNSYEVYAGTRSRGSNPNPHNQSTTSG